MQHKYCCSLKVHLNIKYVLINFPDSVDLNSILNSVRPDFVYEILKMKDVFDEIFGWSADYCYNLFHNYPEVTLSSEGELTIRKNEIVWRGMQQHKSLKFGKVEGLKLHDFPMENSDFLILTSYNKESKPAKAFVFPGSLLEFNKEESK
ncbi:hypothetical protein DVB69_01290 [Sporosarcina sp. BI001-red]|uniref:hypothetical protein n=1 Tax=Sporosarcina sp. BI001-red TaxID=2282866 RepID=UPI000E268EE4|nr:hypothetical protein [Sporosarcina sp. BI001-red]REB11001.1 hypothetical protein DVB69_01290 [Sporosarcina sp. BI001-red]